MAKEKSEAGVFSSASPFGSVREAKTTDEPNLSSAPLVDQALEYILEHRNDPYVEPREQVAALREEVDSLWYRASDSVRSGIRKNPWQSVGIATFVGFIWGITR